MKNEKTISRRQFIGNVALGTAALAVSPFNSILAADNPWNKKAKSYTFRMIGHGHIDPVWLWRWTEGISVVHSTFRSALDRMKESPDMVFSCSSAQFYQWVEENDPAMLDEIRERIKEGRWEVVGGWWVEPDMNIPSGEAMVRQGLYGQRTMQRLLNKRATVGFNPDAFGHTGSVPQIIRLQGMEDYVFMRPAPHEKDLPSDLFWWEGIDGTKVLTYRIQDSYGAGDEIRGRLESVMKKYDSKTMNTFMSFFGVGDHGGGPTKANLRSIDQIRKEKDAPIVTYSGAGDYFDEIRANKSLNIPVIKEDLQHHAPGCYTADCAIKKNNRLSEAALVTAEKVTAIGSYMWSVNYPKEQFTSAWHKLLFMQFHDSLAGTSLAIHSEDAKESYNYALSTAHDLLYMALQKLEWQVATEDPDAEYMLVFNPHAWDVKANVLYDFGWRIDPKASRITTGEGKALPYQEVTSGSISGRYGILIPTTLPAMGYQQIKITRGDLTPVEKPAKAENNTLENEYYKVSFQNDGSIRVFDKEIGRELFTDGNGGCRGVVITDTSDTWSHDIKTFDDEVGSFGKATVKVIERGPVRATARITSLYGDSKLIIDWSLYTGSRKIEAKVTLDWHERHKMLKFSFPVNITSPVATYEIPYGSIVRETNGNEDPGQRWIDVTGEQPDGPYGLTIINDAKYGYNVKNNDMRISVTRSAPFAHHVPHKIHEENEYVWMEQGIQTFRMELVPHTGNWKDCNIPKAAEEFLSPPEIIYQGIHTGTMPKSASYLVCDAPNVIVTSVKKSEDGDDLIVRCVETHGIQARAKVTFPSAGYSWSGDFKPFEIKTLRYKPGRGAAREVNLLEE